MKSKDVNANGVALRLAGVPIGKAVLPGTVYIIETYRGKPAAMIRCLCPVCHAIIDHGWPDTGEELAPWHVEPRSSHCGQCISDYYVIDAATLMSETRDGYER